LRQSPGWLRHLDAVEKQLRATYAEVAKAKPKGARVLVMTYPQPFVAAGCLKPALSVPEIRFVLEDFLPELNRRIDYQASVAGFEVVDTTQAFVGARICEGGHRVKGRAINVIALSRLRGGSATDLVRGSFHPTQRGHQMLSQVVLAHLARPAPPGPGCSPGMPCPPTASPAPPIPPPGTTTPFPPSTGCSGHSITHSNVVTLTEHQQTLTLTGAAGSRYCYAGYKASWKHRTFPPSGRVAFDVGSVSSASRPSVEVLTRQVNGEWSRTLVLPAPTVEPGKASPLHTWSGRLRLLGVTLLVVAFAPWIVCLFTTRWRVPAAAG
jgi:hypothetical protein